MKDLYTEIEIFAPAERVWQLLTDFDSFPSWNPFIRKATGEARVGSRLEIRLQPPGGSAATFRPTVLEVEPGRKLRWLGRLLLPGLFDGEYKDKNQVRFIQRENFQRILVPLFASRLGPGTILGFEHIHLALKARAEQGIS